MNSVITYHILCHTFMSFPSTPSVIPLTFLSPTHPPFPLPYILVLPSLPLYTSSLTPPPFPSFPLCPSLIRCLFLLAPTALWDCARHCDYRQAPWQWLPHGGCHHHQRDLRILGGILLHCKSVCLTVYITEYFYSSAHTCTK